MSLVIRFEAVLSCGLDLVVSGYIFFVSGPDPAFEEHLNKKNRSKHSNKIICIYSE